MLALLGEKDHLALFWSGDILNILDNIYPLINPF